MSGPKWHPGLHQICRAHTSAIFRNAVFDSQRVLSALPLYFTKSAPALLVGRVF
ncbi:hypothetical protein OHAE_1655 [Ochrobactrum soli]|uniref:Uncharacterized protein n=1 Tax=Ochrobactrum soli TaxID=2448455 RepID=A0A2P9HNS9_9HYPH|nr:hypothetical protein OHAE_1655 [[Ochrobactrum] soli]